MTKYLSLLLVVSALGLVFVLAGCRAQQRTAVTPKPSPAVTPAATAANPAPATKVAVGPDEASCPVLGTVMKKADMIPIQHNGKTHYLCCADCRSSFKAEPEKYINHPAPPTLVMSHD